MIKAILNNIQNWVEIYFWVPISFLSIYLLSLSAYFLSGRSPRMNLDWMPELGVNLFKCICAIVLTSITKESLWGWMPLQDKLENKFYAAIRQVLDAVVLFTFLWLLFNR